MSELSQNSRIKLLLDAHMAANLDEITDEVMARETRLSMIAYAAVFDILLALGLDPMNAKSNEEVLVQQVGAVGFVLNALKMVQEEAT